MKPELLDFVVSYDITDNRKRKKIADILEEYGHRVQYSVFEITIPASEVRSLRSKLIKNLRESTDTVRYYSLCQKCITKVAVDSAKDRKKKRHESKTSKSEHEKTSPRLEDLFPSV